MTAPVAVAPAAPAPVVIPEIEVTNEGLSDSLMESLVSASAKSALAESEGREVIRDAKTGKFAKAGKPETKAETPTPEVPAEVPADVPVVPAEGEPTPETPEGEGVEEVALPEGMVAVPTITGRTPMAQFKVFDADGELEAPDIQVEFQANGKPRKVSLDHAIKLAQFGVYNEEREQTVKATQQRSQRVEQAYAELETYAKAQEARLNAILTDDNVLLSERDRLAKENTPEAQRERLEREKQEFQVQQAVSALAMQGQQFFTGEVLPSLQLIKDALPEVSPQEIDAKAVLDSERFKTIRLPNGDRAIDPQHYGLFRQYVAEELIPWAQHIQQERATQKGTATKAATDKANAQVQDAQIRGQQKTNLVSKVLKPVGTRSTPATPPKKPITNIDDAMDDAIKSTLAAMSGAST